jgi:DNA-binding NarL/FixJ family response regulator
MQTDHQLTAYAPPARRNGNVLQFYAVAPSSRDVSDRELQVLTMVADGFSNKEIASALGISVHTVARHVTNVMRKLSASNRAEAATRAIRSGLIGT